MINKSELPKNWEIKKLGEVCKLKNGFAFKSTEYKNEGVPVIRISDIKDGIVTSKKAVRVSPNDEFDNYQIENNDIIVAMSGATTGKFGIYRSEEKAYQNQRVGKFKILDESLLLNEFLYYQIHSLKRQIEKDAYGGAQPNISSSKIEEMQIVLPPLAEQDLIVAKIEELFSELDAGLESLKTAQRQLKIYRQAVLKWAFEGKLTNDNLKDGELPAGWNRVKISEIAEVRLGRQRSPQKAFGEHMRQYLRAANVTWDGFNLSDVKSMNFSPKEQEIYYLKKGDVLLSEASGSVSEVGKPAIWSNQISNCCFQNTLIRVRPHNLESSKFLHLRFYFDAKVENFRKIAKGVGIHHLGAAGMSNWTIPFPPVEEQKRIVQEIESRLSVCDKLEETIHTNLKQAEALRQSILKKAFEGKLVKAKAVEKPKRTAFYQMQTLGLIVNRSKQKHIRHGEMTLAKYAFLADKIYGVPIYENYQRWHLGPYPAEIKKTVNNREYFKTENHLIRVLNEEKLFKYHNEYKEQIENAVDELAEIFSSFDAKDRSHKTELLATVCKVVEDVQTTEIETVRQSMAEWKIDLKDKKFKNKAEKFDEDETAKCLAFIVKNGWDKKLIK